MKKFGILLFVLALLGTPERLLGAPHITLTSTLIQDEWGCMWGKPRLSAAIPLNGYDSSTIGYEAGFSIVIGDLYCFSFPFSAADFSPGGTHATYRGDGVRIEVDWTGDTLTIKAEDDFNYYPVSDREESIDKITVPRDVTIVFGSYQFSRKVDLTGKWRDRDRLSATLSGSADMTGPSMKILSPKPGSIVDSSNSVFVSVLASDPSGLSNVSFFVGTSSRLTGGESFVPMSFETNRYWAEFEPQPGTNYIFVRAVDTQDNWSTQMRSVFYRRKSALRLAHSGAGRIVGLKDGDMLDVGRRYQVTAVPDRGNVLANWSIGNGSNISSGYQGTLSFWMKDGLVLNARFVSNPFSGLAGNYSAFLCYDSSVGNFYTPGVLAVRVTRTGAFSGKVSTPTGVAPFSGQFMLEDERAENAYAEFRIPRRGLPDWHGTMRISFFDSQDSHAKSLSGVLRHGGEGTNDAVVDAVLRGEIQQFTVNPTNQGCFHLVCFPSGPWWPDQGPLGCGYGTMTIDARGRLILAINFPDQVPLVTYSSTLGVDGLVNVFTLFSGNKAGFYGTFHVQDGVLHSSGELAWTKLAGASRTFYPEGYFQYLDIAGAIWTPRTPASIVNWSETGVSFYSESFGRVCGSVIATNGGFVVQPETNRSDMLLDSAHLNVNSRTGRVKGDFKTADGIKASFSGITISPWTDLATKTDYDVMVGFFVETNRTGRFVVDPNRW